MKEQVIVKQHSRVTTLSKVPHHVSKHEPRNMNLEIYEGPTTPHTLIYPYRMKNRGPKECRITSAVSVVN